MFNPFKAADETDWEAAFEWLKQERIRTGNPNLGKPTRPRRNIPCIGAKMNFKEKIEQEIKSAAYGSLEKNLFKVLLGEIQKEEARPNCKDGVTDKWCIKLVNKFVKDNEETLSYLRKAGATEEINKLERENHLLMGLLPDESIYWSKQDIQNWILDEKIDLSSFASTGQAIGKCMSQLKGMDVRGEDVKVVIEEMMKR